MSPEIYAALVAQSVGAWPALHNRPDLRRRMAQASNPTNYVGARCVRSRSFARHDAGSNSGGFHVPAHGPRHNLRVWPNGRRKKSGPGGEPLDVPIHAGRQVPSYRPPNLLGLGAQLATWASTNPPAALGSLSLPGTQREPREQKQAPISERRSNGRASLAITLALAKILSGPAIVLVVSRWRQRPGSCARLAPRTRPDPALPAQLAPGHPGADSGEIARRWRLRPWVQTGFQQERSAQDLLQRLRNRSVKG